MSTAVAISYTRVSSEQQAGETFTSLEDQDAANARCAARLGATIVARFVDAGYSGSLLETRPGLQQMLAYCAKHPRTMKDPPGYVLALNGSRWGRFDDPDTAAWLRVQFRQLGWIVQYAEGDDSTDVGVRHILRAIESAEATRYRTNLRGNSVRGRLGTTKQGFWATRAPLGYWRAVVFPVGQERLLPPGVPKARGERIKLVLSPVTQEVVLMRTLFESYASGAMSIAGLARFARGFCAKHGVATGYAWSVTSVKVMLENRAYVGDLPARGRTAERMAKGDWARRAPEYVVENTHEPLTSRELFAQVQQQLTTLPLTGRTTADYRVRGLVTCTQCGAPYVGGGDGKRLADGTAVKIYIDRDGRDKKCGPPSGTISQHLLESAIIREVSAHVATWTTPARAREAIAQLLDSTGTGPSRRALLTNDERTLQARMARLHDAIETGTLKEDEVRSRLATLRETLQRVQRELASLETPTQTTLTLRTEAIRALAADFPRLAAAATGPELRMLLQPWIHRMTFDKRARVLTLELYTLLGAMVGPSATADAKPTTVQHTRTCQRRTVRTRALRPSSQGTDRLQVDASKCGCASAVVDVRRVVLGQRHRGRAQ